jgi:hypothetical protein
MTLSDLTVGFGDIDRSSLLADWSWLVSVSKSPILLTASGDAFLKDADDGSIHLLDVAGGTLSQIASSFDEFKSQLTDKGFVGDRFAVQMAGELIKAGVVLGPRQVYSFKIPPVLGGKHCLENIEPTDIEVHFSLSGQVHEKVRGLPPGTRIGRVSMGGDAG